MPIPSFDAPIPGENYTSDTKNYPWHRPPEITDLDEAIEQVADQLFTEQGGFTLLTMLELGVDVATAADILITTGLARGKWTPDFALLLAGPTMHIMKLIADAYEIEYDMGLEDGWKPKSASAFKQLNELDKPKARKALKEAETQVDKKVKSSGGFMKMKSKKEPEEPEIDEEDND